MFFMTNIQYIPPNFWSCKFSKPFWQRVTTKAAQITEVHLCRCAYSSQYYQMSLPMPKIGLIPFLVLLGG